MNEHMQQFVERFGKVKAYIIGRHEPNLGDEADKIKVVGQEAITFASDSTECIRQLCKARFEAGRAGAHVLLLQNTPGQVTAALVYMASELFVDPDYKSAEFDFGDEHVYPRIGVIISKPGERPAGVKTSISVENSSDLGAVICAIKTANPRAKIEEWEPDEFGYVMGLDIIVDPPMRFEFDHIEWVS